MCTTNIYTYLRSNGRSEKTYRPTLCSASRQGRPCANNVVFQHPPSQLVGSYDSSSYADPNYYTDQLPPTPQYSSGPSTPIYRSGDESDRSYGSSSSQKKRSSGVYVNGQKVMDINRRGEALRERVVLIDNPPTVRTPPQAWSTPHTAPASPNTNTYVIDSSRDSPHRRPVIVDERTQSDRAIQIELVDNHHRSKHSRHASSSSRESRHSDDSEQRRRKRREEKRLEEKEIRAHILRTRIADANAEIDNRPVEPVLPQPKRSSTYRRPSVIVSDQADELAEAVRRMNFEEERREEKARRIARKEEKKAREEEKKEEEAQQQRLRERMMPKRRATVGPGSRRSKVLYDDGVYRWE